jgi:hypothetical protein
LEIFSANDDRLMSQVAATPDNGPSKAGENVSKSQYSSSSATHRPLKIEYPDASDDFP